MIEQVFKEFTAELNPASLFLSTGDILFNKGDAVTNVFFIKSGRIKLIRDTRDGSQIITHTRQQDESIAEASLFSEKYNCSGIAGMNSEILFVKRNNFIELLKDNPDKMLALLTIYSHQIRDLCEINEIKNIRSASERIYAFFESNVNNEREFSLNIPLKDIAYKIGLAHETFYRELKILEKSGKLHRDSSQIKLL